MTVSCLEPVSIVQNLISDQKQRVRWQNRYRSSIDKSPLDSGTLILSGHPTWWGEKESRITCLSWEWLTVPCWPGPSWSSELGKAGDMRCELTSTNLSWQPQWSSSSPTKGVELARCSGGKGWCIMEVAPADHYTRSSISCLLEARSMCSEASSLRYPVVFWAHLYNTVFAPPAGKEQWSYLWWKEGMYFIYTHCEQGSG